MSLTRDAIFAVSDIEIEEVQVPEWGGSVFVKGLTGTERDAYEAAIIERRGANQRINMHNLRAKLAVLAVCDADGKRLFTDKDADALGKKSAAALQRVFMVAQRLSGLTNADVEELSKNSTTATEDSTSD